jgi:hypothetical protein
MLLESYTKKNTFNDRYIMLLHTDQDWKFDLHLLKVVKCHILVNCHTYGLFVQDIQEYCVSGCFYILNLNTKIVFVLENHLCHSFIHVVLFFSLNNIHVVSYGWSSVISLFCLIFCISVCTLIRKNGVALVKLYLSYLFIIFTFFNVKWHIILAVSTWRKWFSVFHKQSWFSYFIFSVVLRVHDELVKMYPALLLILVPRHPEDCKNISLVR